MKVFAQGFYATEHQVPEHVEHVLDPFQDGLDRGAGEFAGVMRAMHVRTSF